MSRCRGCNNVMSDSEMRRRDSLTDDFTDLCTECYTESQETRNLFNEWVGGLDIDEIS
jgi:hypothetical protein